MKFAVQTTQVKRQLHDLMVKTRVTEETCILMNKGGEGYFWIGGPGEEAFGVPLGMQVRKGQGPDHDYLHLHYRGGPIVNAMGADPLDQLRQMAGKATDPYSGGRQFVEHFAIPEWNVVPVTPTIETQYAMVIGTAHVQRRHGGEGISIVTGGDAGAAEGDIHTCLNWASRPGQELPCLIVITHNQWGISTPCTQVQSNIHLNEWATPYGIRNSVVDGNDVEASWDTIAEAMAYIRIERKPYCVQANVSRLYGHSSASGANRVNERDCIPEYEERLIAEGLMTREDCEAVWERWRGYLKQALEQVRQEPYPDASDIWNHVFAQPVRT